MITGPDDKEDTLNKETESATSEEIAEAVPATAIVKAVEAARKGGKKKAVKKPAKKKGKTAPRGKASKRGPKGWPESKRLRKGDAAYGKRVAAARTAKGLSQYALAEKLGVTQPAICNIERGTLAAGIPMQKALKKALGVEMTKACQAAIDAGKTHIVIRERKPRAKKSKK